MNDCGCERQPGDYRYDEICRVWEQFRIANLNVRYYGHLAQNKQLRISVFQIAIAVFSLFALVVLASPQLRDTLAVYSALVSSGCATILAGALPFLGWDGDARKYSFLNRSYQIVENQLRDTLVRMRRADNLTPDLIGRAEVVLDSMSRLQGVDEEAYSKRSTLKKEEFCKDVNRAFPADYVWNNL